MEKNIVFFSFKQTVAVLVSLSFSPKVATTIEQHQDAAERTNCSEGSGSLGPDQIIATMGLKDNY